MTGASTHGRRDVRLLLVDDHPVVLEGLAALLDAEPGLRVVATAGDTLQALALFVRERPDVTVLDLRLGDDDGIALLHRLRAAEPRARVLVLSTFDADQDVRSAIGAGAAGYLLKTAPPAALIDAIRRVATGLRVLPRDLAERLRDHLPVSDLTPREHAVLGHVAGGASNREVAERLAIREATVKEHLSHVFAKLGVASRTQAIAEALRRGLVRLSHRR
jgi:DNA-binding NarL/FixJ family response regulator